MHSDKCPNKDRPSESSLARLMLVLFALAGSAVVWFACRYIVPRYEARLMDAGLRPSPAVRGLLIASYCIARYFWWIAPILVAFFLLSPKSRARGATGQG